MSVLAFLQKRKVQKSSVQQSVWSLYRQLLELFASGGEIDTDEADMILDRAGKNESDLQTDLETFQQRVGWSSAIAASTTAVSVMTAASAELQSLSQQIADLKTKLAPKIESAIERHRTAEHLANLGSIAVQQLRETVQDPTIIQRRAELQTEVQKIRERQRQIEESIKRCHVKYWKSLIDSCDKKLNSETKKLDPIAKSEIRKQRLDAVGRLAHAEAEERPLLASLEALAAELRELKIESSALERSAQLP